LPVELMPFGGLSGCAVFDAGGGATRCSVVVAGGSGNGGSVSTLGGISGGMMLASPLSSAANSGGVSVATGSNVGAPAAVLNSPPVM
jgi:hypothetical protein